MNDNFKATKAEFEEWAKEFPSLLEPKATNRKIKECVITIFLENEDSQKFNLWLNDCFHELNEYYALDAINSGIVYRFPNLYTNGLKDTSAVISPLYDNQSRMGKPIFIKWIELGARLELGIRLKVMITFPFDPRIRNPLLSILYCLYNDFTDSRAAIFEALQGVKNTFQLDDSILPSPAPTVDAVGTESKSPKDKPGAKARKKKKSLVPNKPAYKRKWALLYEFYDKHCGLEKKNAMQFRVFCDGYDGYDMPKWIPQDNEVLQNIIDAGRAGEIPKHDNIK